MQRTSVVLEKLLMNHQVSACQEIDLGVMPLDSGNSFLLKSPLAVNPVYCFEQLESVWGFEDKALAVTGVMDPPPSTFHSGMLPV